MCFFNRTRTRIHVTVEKTVVNPVETGDTININTTAYSNITNDSNYMNPCEKSSPEIYKSRQVTDLSIIRPTGISNARWPCCAEAAESFEGTNCGALPRKLPVSNAQRSKCGIKKCVSFNTNNIIKNYRFNKYNSCESNLNTLQYNEILTIHTLITLNNEIKKLTQIKEVLQQNIHAIKSKRFLYSNLIDHDEY